MAARSEGLDNGKRTSRRAGTPGALMSRKRLHKQRGPIERSTGLIVLILGFVGTIVTFHGGWEPVVRLHLSLAATGMAIGLQVFLTGLQWWYYDKKALSWTSRVIDTGLNFAGYGYIVLPLLTTKLSEHMDTTGALISAYVLHLLLSFLIAWYPESRLVSDDTD